MIKTRIQIEDGPIEDSYAKWGLIYISSDNIFASPEKQTDLMSSYPEVAGENRDSRTVPDAFDYKVTFVIHCPDANIESANAVIRKFNSAIRETVSGDIVRKKTITFFNDRKGVKIVGKPSLISEAKSFLRIKGRKIEDSVEAELTIRVTNPKLCDFELNEQSDE